MPEASRANPPRIVLAFDFGKRRIGIACGDTISRTAMPLAALAHRDRHVPWEAIGRTFGEWQPAVAVVGLPYNVDGSESPLGREAREFAAQLAGRFPIDVHLVDERYSSLEAAARLRQARASGLRRRRVAKSDVDGAAACVILERWFDEAGTEANALTNR